MLYGLYLLGIDVLIPQYLVIKWKQQYKPQDNYNWKIGTTRIIVIATPFLRLDWTSSWPP